MLEDIKGNEADHAISGCYDHLITFIVPRKGQNIRFVRMFNSFDTYLQIKEHTNYVL